MCEPTASKLFSSLNYTTRQSLQYYRSWLLSNSINLSLQNKKILPVSKVASTICVFIGFQGVVFWVKEVRFRRETAQPWL